MRLQVSTWHELLSAATLASKVPTSAFVGVCGFGEYSSRLLEVDSLPLGKAYVLLNSALESNNATLMVSGFGSDAFALLFSGPMDNLVNIASAMQVECNSFINRCPTIGICDLLHAARQISSRNWSINDIFTNIGAAMMMAELHVPDVGIWLIDMSTGRARPARDCVRQPPNRWKRWFHF